MKIKKITTEEVEYIYNQYMIQDFPQNELKPFSTIKKLIQRGTYYCYGLFDAGKIKAYGFLYRNPTSSLLLMDYFAVISTDRNMGYGSMFLKLLKENLKNFGGILVEVEKIEKAKDEIEVKTRERRRNQSMP